MDPLCWSFLSPNTRTVYLIWCSFRDVRPDLLAGVTYMYMYICYLHVHLVLINYSSIATILKVSIVNGRGMIDNLVARVLQP